MIPVPAEAAKNTKSAADVTSKSNNNNMRKDHLWIPLGIQRWNWVLYLYAANITER